jgi:hypothetical protein
MRCTNCGVENDENTQYCKNCGHNLNESTPKDTTKKRIPKHIKKITYTGWLAIYLLIIYTFFPIIYKYFLHRPLNGTLGEVNLIILILGILVSVYFYIQFYEIKDEVMGNLDVTYYNMIKLIAYMILLILLTTVIQSGF